MTEILSSTDQTCDSCGRVTSCTEEASGDFICESCAQNAAEAAYERSLGECFRGGEYDAHVRDQLAEARKLK